MKTPPFAVPPVMAVDVEGGDVDEGGGVLDVVLHEVNEVGAAAEEASRHLAVTGVDSGLGLVGGALILRRGSCLGS